MNIDELLNEKSLTLKANVVHFDFEQAMFKMEIHGHYSVKLCYFHFMQNL